MDNKKIAVFPGSFDPITVGHKNIVLRALNLFDEIIIAVGDNASKTSFFDLETRLTFLRETFKNYPQIKIESFKGLTVDFCKQKGVKFIIRGLRTSADFEFERSIGQINKKMLPEIETVFILSLPEYTPLNSSIVRDIIRNGGKPHPFIPEEIHKFF